MKKTGFLQNAGILFSGQLVVSGLGFVGLAVIANAYGGVSLGIFAAALSAASILEGLTKAGFNVAHLKHVGADLPLNRTTGLYSIIKLSLMMLFASTTLYFSSDILANFKQFDTVELRYLTHIFIALLCLRCVSDIFIQTLLGLRKTKQITNCQCLGALVRFISIVFAALVGFDLSFIAWGFVAAEITISAASYSYVRHQFDFKKIKVSMPDFKSYWRTAKPMAIVAVVSGLEKHLDKVLVAAWLGPLATGIYYASQRTLQFFPIFSATLANLYIPTISNSMIENSRESVLVETKKYQKKLMLLVIALGLILACASPAIATFMSFSASEFLPLFLTLLLANVITLVLVPSTELFTATENFKMRLALSLCPRLTYFGGLLLFLPNGILGEQIFTFGLIGIGYAKLLQCLLHFLMVRIFLRQI